MARKLVTSASWGRSAASGVGVMLAAVLGLTACGQQTPSSLAADASGARAGKADQRDPDVVRLAAGDEKPRLTCPTGERSLMVADYAVGARGAATPEDAVGMASLEEGEHMAVSASGQRVWLVRADGTARQEIHLTHLRGWILHMRESCA